MKCLLYSAPLRHYLAALAAAARSATPKMNAESKTVKTRFCLISDTHTQDLFPAEDTKHAFREPLPSADVLLHAGDITKVGYVAEYERMFELLKKADAEVKIVIAGNHDITLDPEYYHTIGKNWMHRRIAEDTDLVKEIWTGSEARAAGITYLEEGVKSFELSNGAKFTVGRASGVYPTSSLALLDVD